MLKFSSTLSSYHQFNSAPDGGTAVTGWNGLTWFKSAYNSTGHVSDYRNSADFKRKDHAYKNTDKMQNACFMSDAIFYLYILC